MKYLLGIDLGTSGTKTVLFDQNGVAIASSLKEYPLLQPYNGWAEQNPLDWWDACAATIKDVMMESGVSPDDIAGLGISGQMHGLVALDENGEVLRNAILWCDGRTISECEYITEAVGKDKLISITANPALPGFTAGKIIWMRTHEPELYGRIKHILLPKDYLRFKLSGEYASEVSDASGTNLFDVKKRIWSEEILDILDINAEWMPKIYESFEVTGYLTEEAAKATGLSQGIPVVGGAGDNAAAAIGSGVVREGRAFTTLGTSGVIFAHSNTPSIDPGGRVHTFCSAVPGAWTVMSCTLSAGGALQWYRNNFCQAEISAASELGIDPYVLMDQQAEKSPIGANRLIFLPYLMGERSPLLNSNARGVFFGLSSIHTRRDMLRAVMEGVVYSQRACLDVLNEMGIEPKSMLATGGGGKSKFWRQMLADVYGCPVTENTYKEGPALGAAILASVGAGLYSDVPSACDAIIKDGKELKPIEENSVKYEEYYHLYKSLYPALEDKFEELSKL